MEANKAHLDASVCENKWQATVCQLDTALQTFFLFPSLLLLGAAPSTGMATTYGPYPISLYLKRVYTEGRGRRESIHSAFSPTTNQWVLSHKNERKRERIQLKGPCLLLHTNGGNASWFDSITARGSRSDGLIRCGGCWARELFFPPILVLNLGREPSSTIGLLFLLATTVGNKRFLRC